MIRFILGGLYKLSGWKIDGKKPDLKKYVIIVAPHTSNWDFFVGWGARNVIGFRPNFLGKKELFQIPVVGWFLSFIGGVPVDRKSKKKSTQLVQQVVDLYKEREEFIMTITPEGTRSYSPKWKTGFYRIAVQAEVPIVKIGFDYGTKTVFVDEPFYPSGDMEREMEEIKDYFRQFKGKNPEDGVK
ncbi:1-acyl-sn-glycerol-3-phosphate acyltransferases [Ekhidna lutea]|uniref:1-acyl-sn-glycerol-3-phosphate acyltransferases n=1 Tax=Ekhidna lutea TaxID=447679 RepID=A0A239H8A0_EKHLU|nr:lysophospholipid acyltransferase family protein [Ekhidna lutea]SNS77268.1 1-acyl-sn-glycerol-3-phosphate acyltransferases [Ekhidna lutea]